jgi:hypothetical protein
VIRAAALGLALAGLAAPALAEPPRVAATSPAADSAVSPAVAEISVTFDQPMIEGWSFVRSDEGDFPDPAGQPVLKPDGKTIVLPVKLKPGVRYVVWLNTARYQNFKGASGETATPFRLAFTTSN